jgi:hypothetical protein
MLSICCGYVMLEPKQKMLKIIEYVNVESFASRLLLHVWILIRFTFNNYFNMRNLSFKGKM